MIYLKKGQALFNNEGMVVLDKTGYYEDGATVVCAMYHLPDEPICSYEAKFIAYGDQVYTITDDKILLEEIMKIDPSTLMGKTKEDIKIDKMVEEIETVENPTPETIPDEEKEKEEEEVKEEIDPISETVETTTEIDENGDEITTTTTTTITEEEIPDDVETEVTTDSAIPAVDEPIVVPELPVDTETIISPTIDEVVSKLKKKKKIV